MSTTIWGQTFQGVRLTQSQDDLRLWADVLDAHPGLRGIVELGTWEGGMALFLHDQAVKRRMGFATYDRESPPTEIPGFERLDFFEEFGYVADMIRKIGPTVVLCDGIDKPRELREFGAILAADDLIAVHDWDDDVHEDDVPAFLVMVCRVRCERDESHTRFFRRIP
jgi:hypothetical protein